MQNHQTNRQEAPTSHFSRLRAFGRLRAENSTEIKSQACWKDQTSPLIPWFLNQTTMLCTFVTCLMRFVYSVLCDSRNLDVCWMHANSADRVSCHDQAEKAEAVRRAEKAKSWVSFITPSALSVTVYFLLPFACSLPFLVNLLHPVQAGEIWEESKVNVYCSNNSCRIFPDCQLCTY